LQQHQGHSNHVASITFATSLFVGFNNTRERRHNRREAACAALVLRGGKTGLV
jgi:hypothetical protein